MSGRPKRKWGYRGRFDNADLLRSQCLIDQEELARKIEEDKTLASYRKSLEESTPGFGARSAYVMDARRKVYEDRRDLLMDELNALNKALAAMDETAEQVGISRKAYWIRKIDDRKKQIEAAMWAKAMTEKRASNWSKNKKKLRVIQGFRLQFGGMKGKARMLTNLLAGVIRGGDFSVPIPTRRGRLDISRLDPPKIRPEKYGLTEADLVGLPFHVPGLKEADVAAFQGTGAAAPPCGFVTSTSPDQP